MHLAVPISFEDCTNAMYSDILQCDMSQCHKNVFNTFALHYVLFILYMLCRFFLLTFLHG